MEPVFVNKNELKILLRDVVSEVFEQKKDFFVQMITDAIENIAMMNAMKEEETTESVSRQEVFRYLNADHEK